jgi:hypothetical protein
MTRCDDSGKPLPPKSRKPMSRAQKAVRDKAKEQKANALRIKLAKEGICF